MKTMGVFVAFACVNEKVTDVIQKNIREIEKVIGDFIIDAYAYVKFIPAFLKSIGEIVSVTGVFRNYIRENMKITDVFACVTGEYVKITHAFPESGDELVEEKYVIE